MKNITFSADEKLIEKAREKARSESTTLNNRVREWMERYVAESTKKENFLALMDKLDYVKPGRSFTRDEMNERR
jgi:hypothetical protein